ncbi:Uncharacterised protein [Mycobacterium tuberculosis]|nr:Uncharacterised protein [Mycobacterium tuberculosis]
MGYHAGEPRPGPQDHQIGSHDGVDSLPGRRRVSRQQPHPAHLSGRGRDRHLATDQAEHARVGLQTGDIGLDLKRDRAHRQHPAFHPEDAPEFVKSRDRIGQHLGQAR